MGFNGIRVLMPFIQVPNNGWLTQSLKFRSLQGPKAHATESDPPKACKLSSAPSHCTTFASHVLVHIVLAEAGVIERQWNFRTNLTSVVCVCVCVWKKEIHMPSMFDLPLIQQSHDHKDIGLTEKKCESGKSVYILLLLGGFIQHV